MSVPATTDLVVVDASALVELVIDGEHRAGADALMSRYAAEDGLAFVTAAHGLVEATSALRRLARSGQLDADDAGRAADWLASLDLILDATAPRARRIWALRDRMSAYDAAYAACAEALEIQLITTDTRLLQACGQAKIAAIHLGSLAGAG